MGKPNYPQGDKHIPDTIQPRPRHEYSERTQALWNGTDELETQTDRNLANHPNVHPQARRQAVQRIHDRGHWLHPRNAEQAAETTGDVVGDDNDSIEQFISGIKSLFWG